MKILSVNPYSYNNFNSVRNNYVHDTVSFSAKRKNDKRDDAFEFSSEILSHLKRKKFQELYSSITELTAKYNPNWTDENGVPLLLLVLRSMPNKVKYDKQNELSKENVLVDIIANPKFDVNMQFSLKNKKGRRYITSYLDEAVEKGDLHLLLLLMNYARNMKDPHDDHYVTLLGRAINTGNKNMELLIKVLQDKSPEYAELVSITDEKPDDETNAKPKGDIDIKTVNKEGAELLELARPPYSAEIPSSLSQIGGLKKAKKDIEEYIITPWKPEIRKELLANHISLPNGFLMFGPSGTGKSFIVSTIAKQTGYPLYIITGSTVGSKWMGETPQKLKNIFDELENRFKCGYKDGDVDVPPGRPSILFFDELDDIGGAREGNTSAGKREDVNALLLHLNNASERGIIAIGATNNIEIVDKALTRSGRFDKKIEVGLPDREERIDILKALINKKPIAKPLLDYIDKIADETEDKSPADLAKYVDTCARRAICEHKAVTIDDFESVKDEIDLTNPKKRIGFSR